MTLLTPESRAGARDLTALFAPRAVAVVGASNDQAKYGNWLSVQALRMRGRRAVYLVSRRGEPVLGEPSYRTLADLPEPVDLVVIAVPAAGFEAAVDDALAAGAKAIVGITAGFGELGAEGRAREAALAARVRAAGAVLLGPNCLGVLDSTTGLYLAPNPLPAGTVGLLSQSGNVALELSRFLTDRGLGFSRFASLGNQADLGAADLIRSCAADPGTELIAVYCEDFGDGRDFVAAAADAVAAGKPVVLLTVGGSAASVRGAKSHTGALTSDTSVIDAACRAAGIDRVTSPRQMADLLTALHRFGPSRARRVAVLADGGGHAALACDLAEAQGLSVPEFGPELSAALRAGLPPSAGVGNPVDIAGAGERDITVFARTLRLLLADPDVDSVLLTGYFGGTAVTASGWRTPSWPPRRSWASWSASTASRSPCTRCVPAAPPSRSCAAGACRSSPRWRTPRSAWPCWPAAPSRTAAPAARTGPAARSPTTATGPRANWSGPRASRSPPHGGRRLRTRRRRRRGSWAAARTS